MTQMKTDIMVPATEARVEDLKLGDRIKIMRLNQKRTLQEIAETSELSRSMISKIENNKAIPSVAALVKVAQALDTNISSLLENDGSFNAIMTTRQKAEENLTRTDKGYSIYPYVQNITRKKCSHFYFWLRRVR